MTDNKDSTRTRLEYLLTTILDRLTSIETRLDNVAIDVDELDSFHRPYGMGGTPVRVRTRDQN